MPLKSSFVVAFTSYAVLQAGKMMEFSQYFGCVLSIVMCFGMAQADACCAADVGRVGRQESASIVVLGTVVGLELEGGPRNPRAIATVLVGDILKGRVEGSAIRVDTAVLVEVDPCCT